MNMQIDEVTPVIDQQEAKTSESEDQTSLLESSDILDIHPSATDPVLPTHEEEPLSQHTPSASSDIPEASLNDENIQEQPPTVITHHDQSSVPTADDEYETIAPTSKTISSWMICNCFLFSRRSR